MEPPQEPKPPRKFEVVKDKDDGELLRELENMTQEMRELYQLVPRRKNWPELPNEIKHKLIAQLDLKTRLNLRVLSHQSVLLTNVKNLSLHFMRFEFTKDNTHVVCKSEGFPLVSLHHEVMPREEMIQKLITMLNMLSYLKYMLITDKNSQPRRKRKMPFTVKIRDCDPIPFENLISHIFMTSYATVFFLLHCTKPLKSVQIKNRSNRTIYRDFIDLPKFYMANDIKFGHTEDIPVEEDNQLFNEIIKRWLQNDVPIGNYFFQHGTVVNLREFLDLYNDRVVDYRHIEDLNEEMVRLRTDDPSKHFVVRSNRLFFYRGQAVHTVRVIDSSVEDIDKDFPKDAWLSYFKQF